MGRLNGGEDDMRQFNYYGHVNQGGAPNIEEFTEDDILKLEREVEELLRNRVTSAGGNEYAQGIVNINQKDGGFQRGAKSAQVGKRQHMKNNLMMNAAYQGGDNRRQTRPSHAYQEGEDDEAH
jgi:hypothetical protein